MKKIIAMVCLLAVLVGGLIAPLNVSASAVGESFGAFAVNQNANNGTWNVLIPDVGRLAHRVGFLRVYGYYYPNDTPKLFDLTFDFLINADIDHLNFSIPSAKTQTFLNYDVSLDLLGGAQLFDCLNVFAVEALARAKLNDIEEFGEWHGFEFYVQGVTQPLDYRFDQIDTTYLYQLDTGTFRAYLFGMSTDEFSAETHYNTGYYDGVLAGKAIASPESYKPLVSLVPTFLASILTFTFTIFNFEILGIKIGTVFFIILLISVIGIFIKAAKGGD